jgi:hypothetical protein
MSWFSGLINDLFQVSGSFHGIIGGGDGRHHCNAVTTILDNCLCYSSQAGINPAPTDKSSIFNLQSSIPACPG